MKYLHLKKIIFLLSISLSTISLALEIPKEEFCKSLATIVENQPKEKTLTAIQAFQILYLTRTLISPIELKEANLEIEESTIEGEKIIMVNLPNPSFDAYEIESLKKLRKEITRLTLYRKLKKNQNEKVCLDLISAYPEDYQKFVNYIDEDTFKKELKENYRNARMMSLTLHQLKSFERRGWKIQVVKNLFDMYSFIESNHNLTQILLVNHSDEFGRLYDAEKNILPKGAFSNLPENIKKLTIFSCHPQEVIKYYGIEYLKHKFTYYYPQLKENFKNFFGDSIPVLAIRSMMKIDHKPNYKTYHSQRFCSLNIEGEIQLKNLIIDLNNHLISAGTIEHIDLIKIDCNLLKVSGNVLKLYYLKSNERLPLRLKNLSLDDQNSNNTIIHLNEYLSTDKTRHIVTIGTTGGTL